MDPMEQFLESKKETKDDNKSITKIDLENILDSYIQKIDEKEIQIKLDIYKIKVIEKKEEMKYEIFGNEKPLKKKSSENLNNIKKDSLNGEEIFSIVKFMFDKFKLINRDNYDIKIEGKKLELKKIIDKLFSYGQTKKNNLKSNNKNSENTHTNKKTDNSIKIKQEEINNLCICMNDKIYQRYFLIKINNFRALGNLEIPKELFDYFTQIFSEISKHLIVEENNNKDILINYEISRLMIVISQTFYCIRDGQKEYIQKKIADNKVYHIIEFWQQIIKNSIENEIKKETENYVKNVDKDNEETIIERRNTIAFGIILPTLSEMNGFGINKEEMKKIVLPFFDKYGISDKNKQIILGLIDCNKMEN